MVIKCSFLVPRESTGDGTTPLADLRPLPEYIIRKGPYVNNKEGQAHQQIITIYDFDVSRYMEAWEFISKELDPFRRMPKFTLSVRTLKRSRGVKGYQIRPDQGRDKPVSQPLPPLNDVNRQG